VKKILFLFFSLKHTSKFVALTVDSESNADQMRQSECRETSQCTGMCTRPFRPRPRRDRDVGNCVWDETKTEMLQVAETLPRRLVKSSKQFPQIAAYINQG